MRRLEGKRAVVTGAGSGLGRASALRFSSEGSAVACVDLDGDSADATAAAIRAEGGSAIAVPADVSDEADAEAMVGAAVDAFGGLDIMFANAGIAGSGRAGDTSLDQWNRVIAVNLTGVWLSARAAIVHLVGEGRPGSILCTASVGGMVGVPGIAAYAAAKAGVIGLVRQIAVDYGPEGIRANAISPGTVPTPLVRRTYEEGGSVGAIASGSVDDIITNTAKERFPLGRVGTERDIADAAVYLASDESSWVTGHTLVVDGGMTAK